MRHWRFCSNSYNRGSCTYFSLSWHEILQGNDDIFVFYLNKYSEIFLI